MFKSPGEIIFSVFNYGIHWYGVIMALAITIGLLVIFWIRSKYYENIPADTVVDLAFYLIIFGIIGARLYYALADFHYYFRHPLEIFQIWNGGLSIHGCIIGALIACIVYCKKNDYNFFTLADLFTYGLVVGQVIGRWGNFFNSEAFGKPTDLPWKLFIPEQYRPLEYVNYQYFHPTFLYESLLNILVFVILFFVVRKIAKDKQGLIFFSYFVLYSVVRFFIESIRIDSILNIGFVPIAQIMSIVMCVVGLLGIMYIYRAQSCKG